MNGNQWADSLTSGLARHHAGNPLHAEILRMHRAKLEPGEIAGILRNASTPARVSVAHIKCVIREGRS